MRAENPDIAQLRYRLRRDFRHIVGVGEAGNITGGKACVGNQDAALGGAGSGEGCCQLRAAIERVGAFASLGLDKLGDDREAFSFGEPGNRLALRLDPRPERCCCFVETRSFEVDFSCGQGTAPIKRVSGLP